MAYVRVYQGDIKEGMIGNIMNLIDNVPIGRKLTGSFLIIAAIVGIVAIIGYSNMKMINDGMTTMYHDRLVPIQDLGAAYSKLYEIRG